MKEKYIPISCAFYDELELWALRKTNCKIVYLNDTNERQTIEGVIENLFTKEKVEFLLLKNGFQLRLDQLVTVNDKPLPDVC